jgi:xanthosine utilization system XapX-like protein
MKNLLYLVAGLSAGIIYFVVKTRQVPAAAAVPVEDLAHKLQDAWADHHTVA